MHPLARTLSALALAGCSGIAPPGAQVVLVGEIHDNAAHHARQAEEAARLAPAAIVFEMIPAAREAELNSLRSAGAAREEIAAALDWEKSGWPDLSFYAAIWEAAPQARLYGAELPRDVVRRAVKDGAAASLGPEAARIGLTEPLPAALQAEMEREQADAHCGMLPAEMLPGMVEAQRLRDGAIALATLRAWAETGGPVLVIAGNGHVRADRGVPALLRRADPGLTLLAIGQGEAEDPAAPFDRWLVSAPIPRPDPCAAFRSG